jgi:serine/threonine protein phosphatase 1
MYYIIGDIHGCLNNLNILLSKITNIITEDDTIIFLGDYIDRGPSSHDVIKLLIKISGKYNVVFLKGNHEDMLLKYLSGMLDFQNYFDNGGFSTLRSYREKQGNSAIPSEHISFFENLKPYYEKEDFIAIHAGLNPGINNINEQSQYEMLWIRQQFYKSSRRWEKTIIFGHTPCSILHGENKNVYFNEKNNIIGIDTGACYGGLLTCLRWPDKTIFQG